MEHRADHGAAMDRHGRHALICRDGITGCILYSACSWKSPQMLIYRKQDIAYEREKPLLVQLVCFVQKI